MTKFYQYINESSELDKGTREIDKRCKPFIKELTSSTIDHLLISGRKGKGEVYKGRVKKDRKPKDTPQKYHEYTDELFYDKFGIKARSQTLFCTLNKDLAWGYGDSYIIFPEGQYKLIYSKEIDDIYMDIILPGKYAYTEKEIKDQLEKAVNTYEIVKFHDIQKINAEIMLHCDIYYAIDFISYFPQLIDWLQENYNANIGPRLLQTKKEFD